MEVSQYTPDAFPLGDNRRLLAPFWADVDTRNGGDVFYRETTDPNLLQQATNDVTATFVDQRTFKATWLLIATWYKVAFFGASGIYTSKVRKACKNGVCYFKKKKKESRNLNPDLGNNSQMHQHSLWQ